jgi:hypothetical protein
MFSRSGGDCGRFRVIQIEDMTCLCLFQRIIGTLCDKQVEGSHQEMYIGIPVHLSKGQWQSQSPAARTCSGLVFWWKPRRTNVTATASRARDVRSGTVSGPDVYKCLGHMWHGLGR